MIKSPKFDLLAVVMVTVWSMTWDTEGDQRNKRGKVL
jgi:hypothetical protein